MSSNTSKTGTQIVVESLERHGVTHLFGIPGAKIDKVFDTLKSSSIETVVCRDEQNAAFIAGGIGRLTGRAGVAIATSGPGVSNLATGLAPANSDGDPMVALGGSVATRFGIRGGVTPWRGLALWVVTPSGPLSRPTESCGFPQAWTWDPRCRLRDFHK
jgi:hypothetical protein